MGNRIIKRFYLKLYPLGMVFVLFCALYLKALSPALAEQIKELSLADYARHAQFIDIKISPQGTYLAATSRNPDGSVRLTALDVTTREVLSVTQLRGNESVEDFYWVSNDRLLITTAREIGSLEQPILTGELSAMNVDGSRRVILTGPRSRDGEFVFAELIDVLPMSDGEVLISQFSMRESEPFIDLYRMRVDSGRKRSAGRIPIRSFYGSQVQIVADSRGVARVARGVSPDNPGQVVVMYRQNARSPWQRLGDFDEFEGGFIPLTLASDEQTVIGLSTTQTDTQAISYLNVNDKSETIVAYHPDVDLYPIFSYRYDRPHSVIGASFENNGLETVFFADEDDDYARVLQQLTATFPNASIQIRSSTVDHQKMVLAIQSANQPRQFYLFDQRENVIVALVDSRPWLSGHELPTTQAVTTINREGTMIRGMLTLPSVYDAQKLPPLVVLPHSGPYGVRDSLAYFDLEAKLLAEQGYAVWQPNFRGSAGFGLAFERAGFQNWGTGIVDDITDSVMALIEQGKVDGERVCIYGASFGGYAAMMSAIREPELYRCAIGFAGFYDLNLMFQIGDLPRSNFGRTFLERALGTDSEERKQQSPVARVNELQLPVLVIHGEQDMRAPIDHAEAFRSALIEHQRDFEWLVKANEGHGFYKPENNVERWQVMLDFLDKHLRDAGNSEEN
ncbi:MAG: prolyl oligopeptidase family serine peptidase [Aliidiomarina sp.]|uniref:alpha/beta hydrolase family protein n=1 Tax=Aliidiomarina sp. TaxID=1872439 RepID=UPI0025C029F7|nr:prolyl oligopeptidase family serine peptidase [Aliidiomarina sp.]MCH8501817.1 prolyl oligopeptidase family serine peptidase [Aliidiomarina sp.]